MTATQKPFLSTRCEARDFRTGVVQQQYIDKVEQERTGYMLIGDALVPESFIERVLYQMGSTYYPYGTVLKENDLFLEYFLDSLTPEEHEVLMPVVLEIMTRGKFPLHIATATDMGKQARIDLFCTCQQKEAA